MRILLVLVLVIICTTPSFGVDLTKIAQLTSEEEINSAIAIKDKMVKLQNNINSCKEKGGTHEQCFCENEKLFKEQQTLIKDKLEMHPNWLEIGWFKFKYKDKNIKFNAKGLQKQSEMKLNCI